MIVVKLRGGLGNQMFQYALGRYLAEKHKTSLFLDLSVYYNSFQKQDYTLRGYELGAFNIQENLVLPPKIDFAPSIISKRISNVLHKTKYKYFKSLHWINEKNFHFQEDILDVPNNIFLNGYWHSEKYFDGVGPLIRKEFSLRNPLREEVKNLADQIAHVNAVSLHVRRGDYLVNTWAQKAFHILDAEYYKKGLKFIQAKNENLKLYIFSDDAKWVKENLSLGLPSVIVEGNKNYEDLYLMSLCKHNIIANSSFSWWGGWLNSNPDKTVVAPQLWFKDESKETRDLIPQSWVSV